MINDPGIYIKNISLHISHNIIIPLHTQATIPQVTTMLSNSKNVLFLGYNHLLTTSVDDATF